MKRAIVTGPTGALGTALVDELLHSGAEVTAVCRPGSPRIAALSPREGLRVTQCALTDYARLPELTERADVFFHLAWDGSFGPGREDMARQLQNVRGTLDAVRAAKALGCDAFVGAGSQAEYGRVEGLMTPELPCRPESGYGAAKLSAGALSRVLCTQLGLRHCWCRILSLYGPHDGAYTMVMSVISALLRGERAPCTAGEQLWDYLYAPDAARALRLAGERGRDGALYCLGSGEARPLREYILAIRRAVGKGEPDFGALPYAPRQVMHLQADIRALREELGFSPETSFEKGIGETVQWVKDNR